METFDFTSMITLTEAEIKTAIENYIREYSVFPKKRIVVTSICGVIRPEGSNECYQQFYIKEV